MQNPVSTDESAAAAKKPYRAPELRDLGSVTEVTQANQTSGPTDNVSVYITG